MGKSGCVGPANVGASLKLFMSGELKWREANSLWYIQAVGNCARVERIVVGMF